MEFFNVKTREKVTVPDSDIKKLKIERKTSKGVQVRYAVTTEVGGTKLFKFVNEATFMSLNVPETVSEPK
ncbi:MAG: hypothetical protein WCO51_05210 [bacterium]|jgi:hypothetical protein